nr:MAG: hypothetical protein 1 [Leviviridae sp.]
MTTPAVNIDIHGKPIQSGGYDVLCDGSVYNFTGPLVNTLWMVELRPASVSTTKSASGWRNPTNWNHYKFTAITVPSGYVYRIDTYTCGSLHTEYVQARTGVYGDTSSQIGDVMGRAISGLSWLRDSANTKALLRLKDQKVNLSVAFAERKETMDLFAGVCTTIAKQVRAFRHGKPKLWAQVKKYEGGPHWKKTPKAWLQLQYGWNPLMADISGAAQAMAKAEADRKAFRAHVKGRANTEVLDVIKTPCMGTTYMQLDVETKHGVTTELFYYLNVPLIVPFTQLGLTNPLELIWERIPYSFVVDWFIPIGNWLSSLDSDFGWTFYSGFQSELARVRSRSQSRSGSGAYDLWYVNALTDLSVGGFSVKRNVLTSPPGVGIPHFKNPLSATHVANALSLLLNAFR